jgi:hypothetical protein
MAVSSFQSREDYCRNHRWRWPADVPVRRDAPAIENLSAATREARQEQNLRMRRLPAQLLSLLRALSLRYPHALAALNKCSINEHMCDIVRLTPN